MKRISKNNVVGRCLLIIGSVVLLLNCSDEGLINNEEIGKADTEGSLSPQDIVIPWGACDITGWDKISPQYPLPAEGVECAKVEVPLDHDQAQGPTVPILIARQKAKSFPSEKAVFYLAGGPGGSSVWASGVIPAQLPKLNDSFDLVYVDQRGTGSLNYMGCPDLGEGEMDLSEAQKQYVLGCAKAHADKDLNHYLTLDAVKDIEWVRKALQYEKIYLLGVSYGTTVGLEYMRHYPNHVAAAVLDGLAPPDWDGLSYDAQILSLSLDRLIEDCNNDPLCNNPDVSPNLAQDLETRRQMLISNPRPIILNGKETEENQYMFYNFLEIMLEQSTLRYRIPRAIHQAVLGNNLQWNMLIYLAMGMTIADKKPTEVSSPKPAQETSPSLSNPSNFPRLGDMIDYVADGAFQTIVCAEWLPIVPGGAAGLMDLLGQQNWLSIMGYSMALMAENCNAWNVTPVPAELQGPVESNVKTLLTSGDIDINTPKENGEQALKGLPNATHIVIPYTTHPSIMNSCSASIMESYLLADGDMKAVDTSCIANLPHPRW